MIIGCLQSLKRNKMEKKNQRSTSIIFDLGGVLLNIDYNKTVEAFRKLGMPNPEQAFTKEIQAELFQKLEKGIISEKLFIEELKKHFDGSTEQEIVDAWCALLLDFPIKRYEFLKKLSANYRLFVLSNTNIIHLKAFQKIIDKTVGWSEFTSLFEGIGYSHELNSRKPDAEIFEKILNKYSLDREKTTFIDDTLEHVESARRVGLEAIHLKDGNEIWDVLSDF